MIYRLIVEVALSMTGGKMWLTWTQMMAAVIFSSLDNGLCNPKNAGTEFITAFMENTGYYVSTSSANYNLYISALKSQTQVNVSTMDQSFKTELIMFAGQTFTVNIPFQLTLDKFNASYKTVLVTSNFPVTVLSWNGKSKSIDTGIVQPVQNLGKEYRLPSPTKSTERLFQFVIINTNLVNRVTVSQSSKELHTVTLSPYENVLFESAKYPEATQVTAKKPVAVLFGHPCLGKDHCKCSLVFEQLTPVSSWGNTFIVPSISISNQINQSVLLVTSDGSGPESLLPSEYLAPPNSNTPKLMENSLFIQASMPISIHLLELGLMTLIPEESFSTCYLVHSFSVFHNHILVVVKTADKEGVHFGERPLTTYNVKWAEVESSDYSVGLIYLGSWHTSRALWHLTSKMGVYSIMKYHNLFLGSPALSLKVEPDGSKCRAYLGVVDLVQEAKNWADAQEHCWNLNSQLASLNSISTLQHVAKELQGASGSEVWVGLRRSLLSGEWRWLNREPMEFRRWGSGEPNISLITQCGMMSLAPAKQLTWSAENCCKQMPFVCFERGNEISFP
ncbi:hypothetical protein GJAV_G00018000 [Gymnothorax javanicus]|nr:hypothetical protein GJAV_G00018000 [Gymnothorax javanicus]